MAKQYLMADIEKFHKEILECIEDYNNNYSSNKYTLKLSNSDILNITIPSTRLAHLLGIKVDVLRNTGLINQRTDASEILDLLNTKLTPYVLHTQNKVTPVFSDYIEKKLEAFRYNINIRSDDIDFIIKYDKEKTYKSTDKTENCNYFIVRHEEIEDPETKEIKYRYYVLGIMKVVDKCYPVTSRLYDSLEELEEFIKEVGNKQEFIYPWRLIVENYDCNYTNDFGLTYPNRKRLVENVKNWAYKCHGSTSVANDYLSYLELTNKQYQGNKTDRTALNLLKDAIISGQVLTIDEIKSKTSPDYEVSDYLKEVIDAVNDIIIGSVNAESSALSSYSEIERQRNDYKEKNETLTTELTTAQEKIALLEKEKEALIAERDSSNAKVKVLTDAFETVKTM